MIKVRARRLWTKEEDALLRKAVNESMARGGDINWHRIASNIPDRNNKDCRKRWVYILAPSLNKGAWNKTEDEKLLQGIQKHGFRWALVSQVVGSRQPDQCSRRWHESLNPEINNDRWSLLEDEILREAVEIYGRRWTEIVDRYFPNRTPIAAKNRYTQRFGSNKTDGTVPKASGSATKKKNPMVKATTSLVTSVEETRAPCQTIMPKLLWHVPDHTQSQQARLPAPPKVTVPDVWPTNDIQSPLTAVPSYQQVPSLTSSPSPVPIPHTPLIDPIRPCEPASMSPYSYYTVTSPQTEMCTPSFVDPPLNGNFGYEPWVSNDMMSLLHNGVVGYPDMGYSTNVPTMDRRYDQIRFSDHTTLLTL
ncbi:hypothetical protein TESG_02769 [Trichophyton tonsurans CBS 112818]|uniref:Uncharacterized protein n=1 Tax=Trichophyton tonsurans (strain CBS 112818) TaxID=647933 RepID=F2RVD1_TRIT1|nr:hypothetical protein TESG_02769 [Trichophyton tonsurans CBS 112818]